MSGASLSILCVIILSRCSCVYVFLFGVCLFCLVSLFCLKYLFCFELLVMMLMLLLLPLPPLPTFLTPSTVKGL